MMKFKKILCLILLIPFVSIVHLQHILLVVGVVSSHFRGIVALFLQLMLLTLENVHFFSTIFEVFNL